MQHDVVVCPVAPEKTAFARARAIMFFDRGLERFVCPRDAR